MSTRPCETERERIYHIVISTVGFNFHGETYKNFVGPLARLVEISEPEPHHRSLPGDTDKHNQTKLMES